jgi:translation initiation factor IF-3
LIDAEGGQIGIFNFDAAIQHAAEQGLDLVLVTENASPPVVRLGDLKQLLYRQQKKERQLKKKKSFGLKEIQISFQEALNDLQRKAQQVSEFLEAGHQVQVRLLLKGRQRLHPDIAENKVQQFLSLLQTPFKFVQPIKKLPNLLLATIVKHKQVKKYDQQDEKSSIEASQNNQTWQSSPASGRS